MMSFNFRDAGSLSSRHHKLVAFCIASNIQVGGPSMKLIPNTEDMRTTKNRNEFFSPNSPEKADGQEPDKS